VPPKMEDFLCCTDLHSNSAFFPDGRLNLVPIKQNIKEFEIAAWNLENILDYPERPQILHQELEVYSARNAI